MLAENNINVCNRSNKINKIRKKKQKKLRFQLYRIVILNQISAA